MNFIYFSVIGVFNIVFDGGFLFIFEIGELIVLYDDFCIVVMGNVFDYGDDLLFYCGMQWMNLVLIQWFFIFKVDYLSLIDEVVMLNWMVLGVFGNVIGILV